MRSSILAALAAALAPSVGGAAAAEGPKLAFPLACRIGLTCEIQHYVDRDPGPGALDYHCGHRTYDKHNGIDIRILDMAAQRRGVDVLAAAPGTVARLRDGVPDISVRTRGLQAVAGQECGNGVVIDHGDGWETQYCHLARGSLKVKVGDKVQAGAPIGRVGLSGETEFPHLHLSVRHNGQMVDPFAPNLPLGACGAKGGSQWTPQAAREMAYKSGVIFNSGFAGQAVSNEDVEAGGIAPPTAASPVVVAYMRVSEPQQGDEVEIVLKGPDGSTLASQRLQPLDRDKAQFFAMIGRKRPAGGWPRGRYVAEFRVWRGGAVAMRKQLATTL